MNGTKETRTLTPLEFGQRSFRGPAYMRKLLRARVRACGSKTEAARVLGVNKRSLGAMESGAKKISPKALRVMGWERVECYRPVRRSVERAQVARVLATVGAVSEAEIQAFVERFRDAEEG